VSSDNDTSHSTGTAYEAGKGTAEKTSLQTTARKPAGTVETWRDVTR